LDSAEGFNFSRSPQRGTFKLVVYFGPKDEEDLFKASGAKPTKAGGTGAGPTARLPSILLDLSGWATSDPRESVRGARPPDPAACISSTHRLVESEHPHDIRILRLWEDGIGPG
jgi:hypothetical protein